MAGRREDRDHYDRPSWKEIDNRKDKNPYTSADRPRHTNNSKALIDSAKKDYLKEINQMFGGIKGSREFNDEYEALKKSLRLKDFPEMFKAFVSRYEFPEEWDFLMLLLDREEEEILIKAAEKLYSQLPLAKEAKKNIFWQKVRILQMTSNNPKIQKFLENLKR